MAREEPWRRRRPLLSGCLLLLVVGVVTWVAASYLLGSLLGTTGFFTSRSHEQGVGVVEVKGVLTAADELIAQLNEFGRQDNIKAIILRIDSPGGAVGASQELFTEVQRVNQRKPVVASMGSVAASGGLYAALGAERIIANPGTLTGSIGVIIKFPNLEELFDKIGYRSETIKSGELKASGSPDRPLQPAERRMLQEMVSGVHEQFIEAVADSRGLSKETVRAFADGRIFTGTRARELRLVDQLGNLNDAALLAAQLGGLNPDRVPELIYPPRREFSLLSLLLGSKGKTQLTSPLNLTPVLAYEWTITP
ncbi:MAG: signal peptide peptidase SppA [Desulfurivibrio sp.]|nr:signal peptide peptidase SppA [Desulfurivibrio sp.]